MSVLSDMIRKANDKLTPSQQRLADFVLSNTATVAFMTAQELGDAMGVSDAAVVRFAQTLGFRGFPELRSALRDIVLEQVGSSALAAPTSETPSTGPELLRKVFEKDCELIEQTAALADWPTYERIARRLLEAPRIWVTGHASSYPLAHYLAIILNQALGTARVVAIGVGDGFDQLLTADSRDVMIGFGFLRYIRYTVEIMEAAKARGVHLVAITDSATVSPLAPLADEVLLIVQDFVSVNWSNAGALSVINALQRAVAQLGGDRTREMLRRWDESLRTFNVTMPTDRDHLKGRHWS